TLKTLLASDNVRLAAGALPVAAAWGTSPAIKAAVAARIQEALARIGDAPEEQRLQWITALAGARSADPAIIPGLGKLLNGGSPALKRHVLATLGQTADPRVGDLILVTFSSLDPGTQDGAIAMLLSRREWITTLLDAIE